MCADSLSIREDSHEDPSRLIPLQGAYNVRDLGGYPTQTGREVIRNTVFRAGDLHKITDSDERTLSKLGIKTIIDFRAEGESAAAPNKPLSSVVNSLHFPIDPANVTSLKHTLSGISEQMMLDIYEILVRDFQDTYAHFFQVLADHRSTPLLFHCSGGKDRTGFAAAMFLSSLGVSREIIMNDYLASVPQVALKYARELAARPTLAPLLTVKRSYLETAFRVIDSEFGGIDSYLANQLKVDIEAMRQAYTVPIA